MRGRHADGLAHRNKGGMLLAVHAVDNEWAAKAKDILDRNGAHDIAKTGEAAAKRA